MTAAALTRRVRRGGWPSRGTTAAGQSSWRSDCICSRGRSARAKIAMTTHVCSTGDDSDTQWEVGTERTEDAETDSRRVDNNAEENELRDMDRHGESNEHDG
jgi:hypothetical protein